MGQERHMKEEKYIEKLKQGTVFFSLQNWIPFQILFQFGFELAHGVSVVARKGQKLRSGSGSPSLQATLKLYRKLIHSMYIERIPTYVNKHSQV